MDFTARASHAVDRLRERAAAMMDDMTLDDINEELLTYGAEVGIDNDGCFFVAFVRSDQQHILTLERDDESWEVTICQGAAHVAGKMH
jgi:hypothetical protein